MLSALDLTDADLRDPRNQFPADMITTLYQVTAQELDRDNIFLDLGRGILPTGFADIGYVAMFEDTVGGVIQAAAAAIDSGFNQPVLRWEQSASSCRLVVNPDCRISSDLVFIIFAALSHFAVSVIGDAAKGRALVGGAFNGRALNGRAGGGSGSVGGGVGGSDRPNAYARLIKAAHLKAGHPRNCGGFASLPSEPALFFDQTESSLEWHRDIINLPNPCANREVAMAAQSHSNRHLAEGSNPGSLSRLSYTYLFPLLDRTGLSIDAAAETFGMAERTLRRKLAAEGASFRQILEQVRRNACRLYFLEGTRSLSEIATKLGYSELSAFTRAYTAWYGRSPSQDMAAEIAVAA